MAYLNTEIWQHLRRFKKRIINYSFDNNSETKEILILSHYRLQILSTVRICYNKNIVSFKISANKFKKWRRESGKNHFGITIMWF